MSGAALNRDVIATIVSYFHPPLIFASYFHESRKRGSEESFRIHSLAQLCQVSKTWLEYSRGALYHDIHDGPRAHLIVRALKWHFSLQLFVRRVFLRGDAISSNLHLVPNVEVAYVSKRSIVEIEKSQILFLERLTDLAFFDGCNLFPHEWQRACEAWPRLFKLSFYNNFRPFRRTGSHGDDTQLVLHTLELNMLQDDVPSIPHIMHNSLHALRLHKVIFPETSALVNLLENQSQSLCRIEIVNCQLGGVRPWTAVFSPLSSLSYLHFHENQTQALLDPMILPTTVNNLLIDWRKHTPDQALAFLRHQGTPPRTDRARSFEFRVAHDGESDSWKLVKEAGENFGIQVTLRAVGLPKKLDTRPAKIRMQYMSV